MSPEHVRVRRQGGELKLLALTGSLRERALAIAGDLAAIAVKCVGKSRDELEAACALVEQAAVRSALEVRRVHGEVDQAFLRGGLPLTQGVTR